MPGDPSGPMRPDAARQEWFYNVKPPRILATYPTKTEELQMNRIAIENAKDKAAAVAFFSVAAVVSVLMVLL